MNPIEVVARRADSFQQRHRATAFLYGVMKKYGDDNAGVLVSNLAYAGFVSLFPLMLVLVTALGIVLVDHPRLQSQVLSSVFSQFPVVGTTLGKNLHALKHNSGLSMAIGLAGLLYGSTGLAQAGVFAMEQVWNIPGNLRPNYLHRLMRSLAFVGTLGLGVSATTILSSIGTAGHRSVVFTLASEAGSVALNFGMYTAVFRVLTPRRVRTRQLLPGAAVGAVVWTALQAGGDYVVGHALRTNSAVYGLFAIVLGLLAWIYLGSEISIYAAEINVVLSRRLWPRGLVQPPLTEADKVSITLQATENARRPEQHVEVWFDGDPGHPAHPSEPASNGERPAGTDHAKADDDHEEVGEAGDGAAPAPVPEDRAASA
ncbi:MAG: YihY/virulence factor BrkB family protein [Acidimicrobiales bacterium]